jgi:hypothetical protein
MNSVTQYSLYIYGPNFRWSACHAILSETTIYHLRISRVSRSQNSSTVYAKTWTRLHFFANDLRFGLTGPENQRAVPIRKLDWLGLPGSSTLNRIFAGLFVSKVNSTRWSSRGHNFFLIKGKNLGLVKTNKLGQLCQSILNIEIKRLK